MGEDGRRKWDSQDGKKQEKLVKVTITAQNFTIKKCTKRREPTKIGRELGINSTGKGRIKALSSP